MSEDEENVDPRNIVNIDASNNTGIVDIKITQEVLDKKIWEDKILSAAVRLSEFEDRLKLLEEGQIPRVSTHEKQISPSRRILEMRGAAKRVGYDAEKLVLRVEQARLIEFGRNDLAEQVSFTNDGSMPYDIQSFNNDGTPRLIEVKSSVGRISISKERKPMFTEKMLLATKDFGNEFVLAFVENIYRNPTIEFVVDPWSKSWWGDDNGGC